MAAAGEVTKEASFGIETARKPRAPPRTVRNESPEKMRPPGALTMSRISPDRGGSSYGMLPKENNPGFTGPAKDGSHHCQRFPSTQPRRGSGVRTFGSKARSIGNRHTGSESVPPTSGFGASTVANVWDAPRP